MLSTLSSPPRVNRTTPQSAKYVGLITLALMAVLLVPLAHAQGVTYTYTGNPFSSEVDGPPWTPEQFITATLTTPGVLPPRTTTTQDPHAPLEPQLASL